MNLIEFSTLIEIKDLKHFQGLSDDTLTADWSKQHYIKLIKNQYHLSGLPYPTNATITILLGGVSIDKIVRKVLECFLLPVNVRIDVWATMTSKTR